MTTILKWATLLALSAIGLSFLAFLGDYAWLATQMKSPGQLLEPSGSVEVTDTDGGLITEVVGSDGQRVPVGLNQISPDLLNATIAVEDASFWQNPGINAQGLAVAAYENLAPWNGLLQGRGGSSISQQLAKNLYIDSPDRTGRNPLRKVEETILALELNRRFSKEQVLTWYLNSIFYGNFAVGIEAASLRYFGRHASDLNLPEAALLAGLPQAPTAYDPLRHFDKAKARQETVLDLMVRHGYLSSADAAAAKAAPVELHPSPLPFHAAHVSVLAAEAAADVPNAQDQPVTVQTTLDPRVQSAAESAVSQEVTADAQAAGVDNAAVVVIDPKSGRILAIVGSANYLNTDISGAVNNTVAPNQPAGAIAPFIYLSAFSQGWLPTTQVTDSPYWLTGSSGTTVLGNADGNYRGKVTARQALMESLTVPTIKAFQFAGTEATENLARSMGLDSVDHASSLGEGYAIGDAAVSLMQLTGAYAVLANGGVIAGEQNGTASSPAARPYVIQSVTVGNQVAWTPQLAEQRVASDADVYLVSNILSQAYVGSEGQSPKFDRPAAFMSGLSEGNRDAWAMGYTPQFAIGVWVGRADNSPTNSDIGVRIARAIWDDVAIASHQGLPVANFEPPSGVSFVRMCGGNLPGNSCPDATAEVLPDDAPAVFHR